MSISPNSIIAVAGATGFVGSSITSHLLSLGYTVHALVRDIAKAQQTLPKNPKLKLFAGTLEDAAAVQACVTGAAACINSIGIVRENGDETFDKAHRLSTQQLIAGCKSAGVNRFILISALGVGADAPTEYQSSKYEGEMLLRRSGLQWTILRPSMIAGAGANGLNDLLEMMSGESAPWLFIPYFQRLECDDSIPLGPANTVDAFIQPVDISDVCRAVSESFNRPQSIGEIFNLVGSDRLTWPQLLAFIRDNTPGTSKKLPIFPMPAPVGVALAHAAKLLRFSSALPFDAGMAIMASTDSVSESNKLTEILGIQPQSFKRTYPKYAAAI